MSDAVVVVAGGEQSDDTQEQSDAVQAAAQAAEAATRAEVAQDDAQEAQQQAEIAQNEAEFAAREASAVAQRVEEVADVANEAHALALAIIAHIAEEDAMSVPEEPATEVAPAPVEHKDDSGQKHCGLLF